LRDDPTHELCPPFAGIVQSVWSGRAVRSSITQYRVLPLLTHELVWSPGKIHHWPLAFGLIASNEPV
jgi:hypothetical protein